jgi:hypothetical membrane protein
MLSDLGRQGHSRAWVFNWLALPAGGIAIALLGVAWSWYLRASLGGKCAACLFVVGGAFMVSVGVFPLPDPRHLWLAAAAYLLVGLGLAVIAFEFGAGPLGWLSTFISVGCQPSSSAARLCAAFT